MSVVENSESPAGPEQLGVEQHVHTVGNVITIPMDAQVPKLPGMDIMGLKGSPRTITPDLMFTQEKVFGENSGDKVVVISKKYEEGESKADARVTVARLSKGETPRVTEFEAYDIIKEADGTLRTKLIDQKGYTDVFVRPVPMDALGNEWRLGITPDQQSVSEKTITVTTAPDTNIEFHDKSAHEISKNYNRLQRMKERIPRWGKRMLVAAGIYSAVASGGLIDKGIDPFQDARVHVESVLPQSEMPKTIDGVALERFKPEVQAEFRQDHEMATQARSNIARTMEELDSHQTEGIAKRAEQFKQDHAEELFNPDQSEMILGKIADASSIDDASKELESFLSFYNINLELDEKALADADASITKSYMQDVVRVLSPLPRHMVSHGIGGEHSTGSQRVETLEISTMAAASEKSNHSSSTSGVEAAHYNPGQKKIVLGVPGKFFDGAMRLQKSIFPTGMGGGNITAKDTILHEWGHAIMPESLSRAANGDMITAIPSFLARDLIGMDEYQSLYGQTAGAEEEQAEAAVTILDPTKGPSHPDQAREFVSKANETRLKVLYQIEMEYPGFTDYMAAQALVEREVFDAH